MMVPFTERRSLSRGPNLGKKIELDFGHAEYYVP